MSTQILGYDGGEVDSKERVEVIFPVNVRLYFYIYYVYACSYKLRAIDIYSK